MAILIIILTLLSPARADFVNKLPVEDYIIYTFISLGLVLFAGMMSGLTVGMMGIDELYLEMKLSNGTPLEKRQARKILPVLNKHHLLLVTLLVANSTAMETLPLFLDEMFDSYFSILLSVTFIFIFGELIPQALCTGPDQLKIAFKLLPIVKVVIFLFFIISYPVSLLLDRILGHNSPRKHYKNDDLKTLFDIHRKTQNAEDGLTGDQIRIIHSAFDMHAEDVSSHMIPLEKTVYLKETDIVNKEIIKMLSVKRYTNLIVFEENGETVKGILKVQDLLTANTGTRIQDLRLYEAVFVESSISALDALVIIKTRQADLLVVADTEEKVQGIVTRKDIIHKMFDISRQSKSIHIEIFPGGKNIVVGNIPVFSRMD